MWKCVSVGLCASKHGLPGSREAGVRPLLLELGSCEASDMSRGRRMLYGEQSL